MTEKRKKELYKLAYSYQYVDNAYIFSGKYSNEEIEYLLKVSEELRLENLKNGIEV